MCSNHIHGGWSDLVTSPIFNSTACQPLSPMFSCDSNKSRSLISIYRWLLFSHQECGGREVITKINLLYITTASNCTQRWLAKVFYFLLVSTQGGPTSQWHRFFFPFTLIFQAQHYFRHLKYIIWRIFLIWKCITLSTFRECIHIKRFMITVMKPYSFLNDFDSILQECVHFYSSTTDQRQSTLHTTNFRYAVLKPFSKIYFCF